jgi:anti-anti-sigma factor
VSATIAETLRAQIAHEGGRVVIRLRGALSGARVPLLETVLHRMETRGRGRLTIDLRDLDSIDAAGAAMVHRSAERALHAGRSVSVLGGDAESVLGAGETAVEADIDAPATSGHPPQWRGATLDDVAVVAAALPRGETPTCRCDRHPLAGRRSRP